MKLKSVKFQIGDTKFNAMSFVSRQVTGMIRQDIWNQLKKQFISEVSISIYQETYVANIKSSVHET